MEMEAFVWGRRTKPWATEQMRLRLVCFPERGDLSARAAAHARAAAVKVRAIGFLSDATASVFTSEPFHAKAGRRCCFLLRPCCAKPGQFVHGLRHDPHVKTSAAFGGRRERRRRRRRTVVPTGLRKRSIRCVRPPACLLVCRWGKRRGRSAFHAFEYFRAIDGCTPQFDHAFHNQPARRPGCGERPLAGELQSFICPALLQTAANK